MMINRFNILIRMGVDPGKELILAQKKSSVKLIILIVMVRLEI